MGSGSRRIRCEDCQHRRARKPGRRDRARWFRGRSRRKRSGQPWGEFTVNGEKFKICARSFCTQVFVHYREPKEQLEANCTNVRLTRFLRARTLKKSLRGAKIRLGFALAP